MHPIKCTLLHTWIHLLLLGFSFATDTLTINQPFRDGNILVSHEETFALGFFSPGKSHFRYVGIWYTFSEETVVWVANRDKPLNDTTGNLSINAHGNLVLHDKYHVTIPLWSTNFSSSSPSSFMAQLLDSGNLVLVQQDTKRVKWQSFDHPTQTILPNLKIGLDKRNGLTRFITSWKSKDDPRTGNSSYRIDPNGIPQLILYRNQAPWWRAGHWNGLWWSGIPGMQHNFEFNASFVNDDNEITNIWGVRSASIFSRLVVEESGSVQIFIWDEQERQWTGLWSAPMDRCDHYSNCGAYGICEPYDAKVFECTCLPGYEPESPRDWYLRDGSGGCRRKRKKDLRCGNEEGFVKVAHVKTPDTSMAKVDMSLMRLDECEKECLRNCSCKAYATADLKLGGGCLTWHGRLMDTKKFTEGGQDLYVRVDASALGTPYNFTITY